MANDPKSSDVMELVRRYNLRRCVVLYEAADGAIGYVTDSANEVDADATGEVADAALEVFEYELWGI